jgi:cytidylate kinase
MTVITISRQYGSGGDIIAQEICKQLGYQYFDKQMIVDVADQVGIARRLAVDYSEDTHEVQTFLDRLFRNTATAAQMLAWAENPAIASSPERADLTDEAVIGLIKRAVRAAYKRGKVVIVGRGGQVLLKDQPGVLHLRIIAPLESRIQRVKALLKHDRQGTTADLQLRRKAQDLIEQRDAASADYLKRFYDVAWDNPLLYHAILNTGELSIEMGVQIVLELERSLEGEPPKN